MNNLMSYYLLLVGVMASISINFDMYTDDVSRKALVLINVIGVSIIWVVIGLCIMWNLGV